MKMNRISILLLVSFLFAANSSFAELQVLAKEVNLVGYVHQEVFTKVIDVCYADSDTKIKKIEFGCGCLFAKYSDEINTVDDGRALIRIELGVKTMNKTGQRGFEAYVYLTNGETFKLDVNYEVLPVLESKKVFLELPEEFPSEGIDVDYVNVYKEPIETFKLVKPSPELIVNIDHSVEGRVTVNIQPKNPEGIVANKLGYFVFEATFSDRSSYRSFLYYK